MDNTSTVAVVRTDRRRGGVAEALALIAHDLAERLRTDPNPVLIPNLDNPARAGACTHPDTLSAMVDAILGAGASSVTIAGDAGGHDADQRDREPFTRLGYRRELWGRPARFVDISHPDETFSPLRWINPNGEPRSLRLASAVAAARCRVVLGQAKAHGVFRAGLGLTNLASVVHGEDRGLLEPGSSPLKPAPYWVDRASGLVQSWRGAMLSAWLSMRAIAGGMRLTGPQRRRLAAVERATDSLVALAAFSMPRISLVDAFHACEGEGPRHGRRVALGTVIAGTDAVAVDAVAAAVLGFEPMEIAYLRLAHATGLGRADLASITILGDPIARPHRFRRHPADPLLRLAGASPARLAPPLPHFGSPSGRRTRLVPDARRTDAHWI